MVKKRKREGGIFGKEGEREKIEKREREREGKMSFCLSLRSTEIGP